MTVPWEKQQINDIQWYKASINKNISLHLNCDYFTLIYKNYCKTLHNLKFNNALDIGISNTGGYLAIMPNSIHRRVALDPAVDMLRKINMLPLRHHIWYKQGFAEEMKHKDNEFDLVIITNTLDHVRNMEKTVKEIERILIPGGYLLFNTYLRVNNPHPFTFQSWEEARSMFKDFSILEHYEITDNRPFMKRNNCYHAVMQSKKPVKDIPIKYENICS